MSGESEVLVVGGGPAGLATAIAVRRRGIEVDLVDRASPPIDKACGEGIMPVGRAPLSALGIDLEKLPSAPFSGVRYIDGAEVAEGRFPGDPGLGVRRVELHGALLRRSGEVGVRCHWGVEAQDLERDGPSGWVLETSAGRRSARWLVAADGLHSRLRRQAGLAGRSASWRRFGVRRHFAIEPWSAYVEVYWSDGCEAYVTPVGERLVGVALLWSGRKAGFDELMKAFPYLRKKLAGVERASRDRGAGPFRQRVRSVVRGNLALVGDASGYVDALTGEGTALAFQQAHALAASIASGDLGGYRRAHRELVRAPDLLTRATLLLSRYPWLRRRVVRRLADDPELFSRLLAAQNRDLPLRAGIAGLARLGLRLASPV